MATKSVVYIRNVDPQTVEVAKRSASARGMTLAEYFEALVRLHGEMIQMAGDPNDDYIDRTLESVKLGPVMV